MLFQERLPCQALAPYIHRYTFIQSDGELRQETCVPDGFVKLFLFFSDARLQYADMQGNPLPWADGFSGHPDLLSSTIRVPTGIDGLMCTFYPSGFFRLFRTPVHYLNNDILYPQSIAGAGFRDLLEQLGNTTDGNARVVLLNSYFLQLLSRLPVTHKPSVANAERLLLTEAGNMNMDDLAQLMATNGRTLLRMFYEQTGISPKYYARVLRINKAFRIKKENPYLSGSSIAYSCGYADQSHFIREFRQFTGVAPFDFFVDEHQIAKEYLGRTLPG